MHTISLAKGEHHYVFRYGRGDECDVLAAVADMAARKGSGFDWVDAAAVSFQITRDQAAGCLEVIAPRDESQ